jgi:hypothetical protein
LIITFVNKTKTDFTTKPTTVAKATLVAQAELRYKKMLEILQVRSNFRIVNIVPTYSSSAGDNMIQTLAFGLVFENDDFVPTFGTNVDGSTTVTKADYIRDKIAEVLSTSFTEVRTVYNPTSGVGLITTAEQSDAVVREGKADAVFAGRAFLRNPRWALEVAHQLKATAKWPQQIERGKVNT